MRVIERSVLLKFGEDHPQARGPLDHWYHIVKEGKWQGPMGVRRIFGNTVDFVASNRAVLNVKGNDYRLIAEINYRRQVVFIRFLGAHAEYGKRSPRVEGWRPKREKKDYPQMTQMHADC